MHTRNDAIEKLGKLIHGIKFAMLTTGDFHSRPMGALHTDFDGTLWFFTHADSPKIAQLEQNSRVNVSFADPDSQRYVSLLGIGALVRDRAKMEELWNPALKAWFPRGLEDPQIALIRVDVEGAEYWDSPSSTMVHLVGLAKAMATGKPLSPRGAGEHKKLDVAS